MTGQGLLLLRASMGPRSEERGNRLREDSRRLRAAALQWGRAPKNAEMQARFLEAGGFVELQWGRAPKNAEIIDPVELGPRRGRASMGPRSEERGNPDEHCGAAVPGQASMGPRSEERGNHFTAVSSSEIASLQWGRAPKNAEMSGSVSWGSSA